VAPGVHARALKRAAVIRGGEDILRAELNAQPDLFERWKDGREEMPPEVFLRIVDIIVEKEVRTLTRAPDSH
jgi:hypothetical protein